MARTNLPGFSANASLYQTHRRYRTQSLAVDPASRMSAIHPEMMSQGGEVINIGGCSPGFLQLGEGSSMTCIPDPTLPGGGGDIGGGGGVGGVGFGGGGGSGSGAPGYHPTEGGKCHADSGYNHVNSGNYKYEAGDWECCGKKMSDGSKTCLGCQTDRKGNSSICANGNAN